MPSSEASPLTDGLELLSLDAGNTVIFLDHARLSSLLRGHGFEVSAEALIAHEGDAKRRLEDGRVLRPVWKYGSAKGSAGWASMVGTMVHLAGMPEPEVPGLLATAWESHLELNLWSQVPEGLVPALAAVRAEGVKVVIVSNSEGMLEPLFEKLGILASFDRVVDSALVGVEKPHPRIFEFACAPHGIAPERALHLGDTYATDVLGAQAAGLRYALIDPYGHYDGLHPEVPRVESVVSVAAAITAKRSALRAASADRGPAR